MATAKKSMTVKAVEPESTARVFGKEEMIPCRSVTSGELLLEGKRSNILYRWADLGDITEVQYQDLMYEIRSAKASFATYPRFIILDDDFIAQNKILEDIYKSVYTTADLHELLLRGSLRDLKDTINNVPKGIQEAIKGLASTMIRSGEIDSIEKIKTIDDIFGTSMLKTLAET